ncbi:MAG: hypothetical protein R2698_10840 [Microthrixaceae bacterium]
MTPEPGPGGVGLREGATPPEPATTRRRGLARWGLRGLVGLGVASALLWIGAIVYGAIADPKPSDYLKDRSFPTAAEPICEAARTDLDAFPPAQDSRTPNARAAVIRQSTARLQEMVDQLRREVPDTAEGKWIGVWLDHWEIHLRDRLDFAQRLRTGGAREEFFETTEGGTQVSRSIDHFAELNKMDSCATPGDV